LKPGDKLPPKQILAEKFGTSRPSVREALSTLEILGITESRGGKGNFIKKNLNTPSYEQKYRELEEEESPFEILEARKAVETEIVGLSAQKATKEEINTIKESLNKMKKNITDIPKIMEIDREFHINIARAAHNNLLYSMMLYLNDLLKGKPLDKHEGEKLGVFLVVLRSILKSILRSLTPLKIKTAKVPVKGCTII